MKKQRGIQYDLELMLKKALCQLAQVEYEKVQVEYNHIDLLQELQGAKSTINKAKKTSTYLLVEIEELKKRVGDLEVSSHADETYIEGEDEEERTTKCTIRCKKDGQSIYQLGIPPTSQTTLNDIPNGDTSLC